MFRCVCFLIAVSLSGVSFAQGNDDESNREMEVEKRIILKQEGQQAAESRPGSRRNRSSEQNVEVIELISEMDREIEEIERSINSPRQGQERVIRVRRSGDSAPADRRPDDLGQRIEHARAAERHLREGGFTEFAAAVAQRIENMTREQTQNDRRSSGDVQSGVQDRSDRRVARQEMELAVEEERKVRHAAEAALARAKQQLAEAKETGSKEALQQRDLALQALEKAKLENARMQDSLQAEKARAQKAREQAEVEAKRAIAAKNESINRDRPQAIRADRRDSDGMQRDPVSEDRIRSLENSVNELGAGFHQLRDDIQSLKKLIESMRKD